MLVATDVLSEGQNLQDAAIIVNYDLPWAIIRLIQRAGRVNRIGQKADTIACYTFLPAEGVERIIRLRARVRQRLRENAEVVGSDETFFEDDRNDQAIRDLFTEKAGILDGEADTEIDLGSHATRSGRMPSTRTRRWSGSSRNFRMRIRERSHKPTERQPDGVLVYVRTARERRPAGSIGRTEHHRIAVRHPQGRGMCARYARLARRPDHHDLVHQGVEQIAAEEKSVGGQPGGHRGPGSAPTSG